MSDCHQLLAEYVKTGSEAAFRELVDRYVDLVYSTANRLVDGDHYRAEDVAQAVFADLARMGRTLSRDVMLGGWLHRHTCFVARNIMRTERRRQDRERLAVEMNSLEDHSVANLKAVAPVLDEAIDELGTDDRRAILLRYFEQRDFRSVGEAMGSSEEAARKRVDRAIEKLHSSLARRGVVLSATALTASLAAGAVSAAPSGLAASISTAALAGVATAGGATFTLLNLMSMTKLKTGIITAALAAGIAVPFVLQHRTQATLRDENESLRQQLSQIDPLAGEVKRLSNLVRHAATTRAASTNDQHLELMRLRGEVGRLRQQVTADALASARRTNGPSALSGITANPQMQKLIRDQQKAGMTMIYKDLAKELNLSKEQTEKLNDLLADNIMENIELITAVLRDGKTREQMDQIFAGQEAGLLEKVQSLLGPEGLAVYQDYTRNLVSNLTAEQFKGMLTGDDAVKQEQTKQLRQLMQEETRLAIANAGLDPDFQTVPVLNFRNIASEEEGEKNLKLLDGIYERVAARAGSFLNAEEIEKFGEFRTKAIEGNRAGLLMNRKMMAPGSN